MKSIEELMTQLTTGENQIIITNPETIIEAEKNGIKFTRSTQSLEENISTLLEKRRKNALSLAGKLPSPPTVAVPAIGLLYDEIRECIIFGLNGAAITLSGILVEFLLKYLIAIKEQGGFEYNSHLWDEMEKINLGQTIERAFKIGILTNDHVEKLKEFKNIIRNPYNHYNIKKITESVVWKGVKELNIKTKEIRELDIIAKDNPVIQAQAKSHVDANRVFDVFLFVDDLIKTLFSKRLK